MRPHRSLGRLLLGLSTALCALTGAPSWAQAQPCRDFAWDVHQERNLFAQSAHTVAAARHPAAAPAVRVGRLYQVTLAPQSEVRYVVAPGKVALADGAFGGMVKFRVGQAGSYRVSLDATFWIDVVADGRLLATEDFSGQRGCANPHKIVVFQMPSGQDLWLQISGSHLPRAQFTITEAPAKTEAPANQASGVH